MIILHFHEFVYYHWFVACKNLFDFLFFFSHAFHEFIYSVRSTVNDGVFLEAFIAAHTLISETVCDHLLVLVGLALLTCVLILYFSSETFEIGIDNERVAMIFFLILFKYNDFTF